MVELPSASEVAERTGRTLLSATQWRTRLVLWTGGVAVGGAAVLFAWVLDQAMHGLHWLMHLWRWAPCLIAPLGFALVSWMTRRFFSGAEGSGIPQVIFLQTVSGGATRARLLRLRVAAGRMVLGGVAVLCGASTGREGPSVHVGAILNHWLARFLPHGGTEAQQRIMIMAGGAAGVAAAFNTPLAGIVFAIEELSRSFEERASGVTLTAVIIAGMFSITLVGDYTYFGQPGVLQVPAVFAATTLAVALAGGLTGGLFSRIVLAGMSGMPWALGRLRRERPTVFALLCGCVVSVVGVASGQMTFGSGYDEARSILMSGAHLPWYYAPARAAATLATFFSGIPTGILSPSLSVGAGLGQLIADLGHEPSAVPFAILGMCAYLAGVTQAPLTALVIVMEMTTQHAMVLPLMVSAAVGTAVSKLMTPSLYRSLSTRYMKED